MRSVVSLVGAGLLAGCASRPAVEGPEGTLRAYIAAAERGDADAAYGLLSKEQRGAITQDELRRAFADHPDELREQAQMLRRLLEEPIVVSGEVPTADGGVAIVTIERGHWRIAGGVGHAESLRTPRQTLRALRRALERRSYDGVLRVLARRSRAQIEDEVRRLLEALDDPDAVVVEIDGNTARVEYEADHAIEMVLEDGEWRVVDMD